MCASHLAGPEQLAVAPILNSRHLRVGELRGEVQQNTLLRVDDSVFNKLGDFSSTVGLELRVQVPVVNDAYGSVRVPQGVDVIHDRRRVRRIRIPGPLEIPHAARVSVVTTALGAGLEGLLQRVRVVVPRRSQARVHLVQGG